MILYNSKRNGRWANVKAFTPEFVLYDAYEKGQKDPIMPNMVRPVEKFWEEYNN